MPPSLHHPAAAAGTVQSIPARAILASRHLLGVLLFGLAAGLFERGEEDSPIDLLHQVDGALVASPVVMVALSSCDSLVGRLQGKAAEREIRWSPASTTPT